MTDQERADRLAALRAARGQDPLIVHKTPPSRPPETRRTRRPHAAMGARILASGITASAVFGLTTVIAAASERASGTTASDPSTPIQPTTPTTPPTTTPVPSTIQTVVLSVPALETTPPTIAAAAAPAPTPTPAPRAAAPVPAPATPAPVAAPAPIPVPVVTAPPAPPPTPPPPATTKPSGS